MSRIKERLTFLYGDRSEEIYIEIQKLTDKWKGRIKNSYP